MALFQAETEKVKPGLRTKFGGGLSNAQVIERRGGYVLLWIVALRFTTGSGKSIDLCGVLVCVSSQTRCTPRSVLL